jgi:hypothetical protein
MFCYGVPLEMVSSRNGMQLGMASSRNGVHMGMVMHCDSQVSGT